ncbi:MAG: type II toxin-antitoxin system YafQ family toxin [Bacteroidales bacterium]|nr:type II toxin-antitoxin system YafQ family toxin [Bacteroidales bacterium]
MYTIKFTGEFKRQMKLCERRGYDMEQLRTAILTLSTEGKLPAEYLPHMLHGDRKGQWECHILLPPDPIGFALNRRD